MKKEKKINSAQPSKSVYQLKEPYKEEMWRIRFDELSGAGKKFAYLLESIEKANKITSNLSAKKYESIKKKGGKFYIRYTANLNSASIGLLLTNIDLSRIRQHNNGEPVFWQMGPERRRFALAQRALYFDENQTPEIHKLIQKLETGKLTIPVRSNKRSKTVEKALGIKTATSPALHTPAISELGYKKISSERLLSRREIIKTGLFNKIGKYPRKVIGLGAMPPVTGWRDTIVMAAVGHMLSFIPRSSIYANNLDMRVKLAIQSKKVIGKLDIPSSWKKRVARNIGAALGAENPKQELNTVKSFYKNAGIKLFRIYTIGSDRRVIKTAELLRQHFQDKIEIFVGQIADKKQALKLIEGNISVDGLIYGHGGGQQCTSAINGMAITTLEDIYEVTRDKRFNDTTLLVEGGIGRSIGTALILGVDACLGNQKFVRGSIETGDLFVQDRRGKICQPYPGTASPVTQIIESEDPMLAKRRTDAAGRTYYSEGKPGFMYYEQKACSMAFWINEYLRHASRTLSDLGVKNLGEMRQLTRKDKQEILRIMSEKTQYLSEAHWKLS